MNKSYFETRKTEIQSEIDSWKQETWRMNIFPLIKNFLLEAKFVLLPLHMKDGH